MAPISEVRVGRKDGELIVNPSQEILDLCDIDITIAGTDKAITMVEGESKEISEEDFLVALEFGHERIKELNALQLELAAMVEVTKRDYVIDNPPEELLEFVTNCISEDMDKYVHLVTTKAERGDNRHEIHQKALAAAIEKFSENEELAPNIERYTGEIVDKLEKKLMRKMIVDENKRLDGRNNRRYSSD